MALYRIEIFKSIGEEKWENVYLVDAGSLEAAVAAGAIIYPVEEDFHSTSVLFDYMRVSTVAEGDDIYTTVPLNTNGARGTAGDLLPLFNTLRADIQVAGGGRPSRKYYRGVIGESDQSAGIVASGIRTQVVTDLQSAIDDLSALGTPLVDPDSQEWVTPTAALRVQMRQLRRGARRTPPSP